MNILILNQFASTPNYSTGAGERHYYLAKKMISNNNCMTIVSGAFNHLFLSPPETKGLFTTEDIEGGKIIWVRQLKYKGKSFSGRIISWFEFLIKIFLLPNRFVKKVDVVIVSSMSIFPTIYAWYLKKMYNIPFILEIRDIWPLTPMQFAGYTKRHPFIKLMLFIEKFSYKNADAIITLLPSFEKHLINILGYSKPIYWIPNAIEKGEITVVNHSTIKFPENKFIVAYAGALGRANAMNCFIDAARTLESKAEIQFVLIGDGPEKQNLINQSKGLSNVHFYPKIKKDEVVPLLTKADVCFISWEALGMYNFGVSANKYNDYMLASKPIISSSNIPDDPVVMANCGIQVKSGDTAGIVHAILLLFNMPKENRELMGKSGFDYLINNNTYDVISKKYEGCVREVLAKHKMKDAIENQLVKKNP